MNQFVNLYVYMTARFHGEDGETGATATEYAMLVAFIALAIVAAVTVFGTALSTFFTNLGTSVGLDSKQVTTK